MTPFLYAFTLPNINRFSQLFHCQNQEKICNNTITKDPATPQVCLATLPCEMSSVLKATIENETTSVITHKLTTYYLSYYLKLHKVTVTSCTHTQPGTHRRTCGMRTSRSSSLTMWLPTSPDLNPVDCAVWDALQQMVYQRRRFTTINQLK